MKKFLLICGFLLVVVPFAYATPIEYEVYAGGSSVSLLSQNTILGSTTISSYFGTVFGVINWGTLYWDPTSLPDVFTLADDNVFSIDFQDGIALFCGDTTTVHAYVTNRGGGSGGTPVSEPANMLLMGTALVGLAGVSRKKIFK